MKYRIILLILFACLIFFIFTSKVHSEIKVNFCVEKSIPTKMEKYLDKLALCESGNNPNAINPVDRDGTPSLGRYQFKPSSFNYFSQKYDIATTSVWNGDEQRQVVREMARNLTDKEWSRQFPDCTLNKSLKYYVGYPPKDEE